VSVLLELRHSFPVSPKRAFEELFGEDYEEAVSKVSRLQRQVLEDRSEPGHRPRRIQVVPDRTRPAAVARVIGQDRFSYEIEEHHDLEALRMDFEVTPDRHADKVLIGGSWALSEAPGGCERLVRIEITVRVPLVGGKIEQQIGADLAASYEDAALFAQRWLQERG